MLNNVWKECYRVLREHGRICINIANLFRNPYIPLQSYIQKQMMSLKFRPQAQIIWIKKQKSDETYGITNATNGSTAWGSWLKPTAPTIRDSHEYILVFSKGTRINTD